MPFPRPLSTFAGAIAFAHLSLASAANLPQHRADTHIEFGAAHATSTLKQAPKPRKPQTLPPSLEQIKYSLPESSKPRLDLFPKNTRHALVKQSSTSNTLGPTPACQDMAKLATYGGAALADYIVNLPSYECHYGLFSLSATQAATVFSAANFDAVAKRFASESALYDASNMKLVNLLIYLRAGYYLAGNNVIPKPSAELITQIRPAVAGLIDGNKLYSQNTVGPSTASETFTFITNMNDEGYYLPRMKNVVQRFTNTPNNPNAANALSERASSGAMTGALTVIFYSHYRGTVDNALQNDPSYPQTLYNFVISNKASLIGGNNAYQLSDAEREAFRFMQYANQKPAVKPMVKNILATSTMTGNDSNLWLEAASSVSYYDNANCAEYGTCNYKTDLANVVLKNNYTCSPSLRIRAQDMTQAQLQESCNKLAASEVYFHKMLQTNRKPVADDNNTSLELVVFDDYSNYAKYAGVLYDIDTNNGGMYLEGNPAQVGNQARFIAHEASWLRPSFQVWNLEHEYIHYLDGRFDMYGDFSAGVAKPTVWWIEGIAEYLSLGNNNQKSIDAAKAGTYKLSTIFGNTYSMGDYTNRAYRWGYMATRFMNERHRADIDSVVGKFRVGDYNAYQAHMQNIGTKYDAEFASWVQSATTTGQPPEPSEPSLPACASKSQLGKNCSISGFASSTQAYAYIMLPTGAKNLRIFTQGGTGDVDLWLAPDTYPSTTSGDPRSTNVGNNESISIANPVTGRWYYIMLKAKQAFSGVSLSASYQ